MSGLITLEDVVQLGAAPDVTARMLDRLDSEDTLLNYTKVMWPVLEPGRVMKTGWALEAISDHLEAVTKGHIRKLLINVPPGFMKSLETNVFWPSWEWGPRRMPWNRYVSAAYAAGLTERDNDKCRTLIKSPAYQAMWGPQQERCAWIEDKSKPCDCGAVFHLRPDRDAIGNFHNNRTGFKLATSVGGTGTGVRGDRFIIDDPHSVNTAESEAIREGTLKWATEVVSTRSNDAATAFIIIMQRVHQRDVAGLFIEAELGFTHLCIPMRFEHEHPHRWFGDLGRCHRETTVAKVKEGEGDQLEVVEAEVAPGAVDEEGEEFQTEVKKVPLCVQYGKGDPRTEEGELAWPELFPEHRVVDTEKGMSAWGGTYAVSGQHQQRPTPRGGGMFHRDDFKKVSWVWAQKQGGRIVRGWDLAGTRKKTSPWTAGVRIRLTPEGALVIEHVAKTQGSPNEVDELIKNTARWDGHAVVQDFPQDPGQAGLHQVTSFAKLLQGYTFKHSPESGSKEDRARPLASQCEAGNVYIVAAEWNDSFLAEAADFPRGRLKDQIDAASRAYAALIAGHDDYPTLGSAPTLYTVR